VLNVYNLALKKRAKSESIVLDKDYYSLTTSSQLR